MILANGKIYDSSEQNRILADLEHEINLTRSSKRLMPETVISALDRLGRHISDGDFSDILSSFLDDNVKAHLQTATDFLKADNLRFRLETEMPAPLYSTKSFTPAYGISHAGTRIMPLGTLFHIAAGNMDALPLFSVVEGLLTGNVNILKLPQADNGLTVAALLRLIDEEPSLAPFIYVFDTPSTDLDAMKKMAAMADGIITWGGDSAVSAVRAFASPGTKLIEWGHKLGFVYISGYSDKAKELSELARHIIDTRQLLCSSCQTVFLDTDNMDEVYSFCEEFLPYLEAVAVQNPINDIGTIAELTLRSYTERLEKHLRPEADTSGPNPSKLFLGNNCSLRALSDNSLELSMMNGNCLVKRLPQNRVFEVLRGSKGHLQTAGLICEPQKRAELIDLLATSGVTRILSPGNMSVSFSGEAHDGEYPLARYVRIVNIEE